jgi:hypothetical protein
MPADKVMNGEAIDFVTDALAKDIAMEPSILARFAAPSSPKLILVGSCCAGSGMDKYILDGLANSFKNWCHYPVVFKHKFVVELNKQKRANLMAIIEDGDCCFFADVPQPRVRLGESESVVIGFFV